MYAKIFASIFDSTVNELNAEFFKIWIALLAFADSDGVVDITPASIANRTRLTLEQVDRALVLFGSPDPMSRSQEHEGRRILPIPGRPYGWTIVNHAHYRDMKRSVDRRDYMRKYMAERRAEGVARSDEAVVVTTEKKTRKKTATHMTPEWRPSPEVLEKMKAECPAIDVEGALIEFRDWWIGEGRGKADWDATFRNRIRDIQRKRNDREQRSGPARATGGRKPPVSLAGPGGAIASHFHGR